MSLKGKISGFFAGIKRFFQRLWNGRHTIGDLMKHKHRFVVLDTETYKEKISFQLSGINIFVFLGITSLVLVFLTALLLAFTPLRELIPGYANTGMVAQTYENARTIDSLEAELKSQEEMLRQNSDSVKVQPTPYVRSKADSLLRDEVEKREKTK